MLRGNFADNVIAGNAGNDSIDGRGGFDFADYRTATSAVSISLGVALQEAGGGGTDKLYNVEGVIGSAYRDTITGYANNNTLYGGSGADNLDGSWGDDVL